MTHRQAPLVLILLVAASLAACGGVEGADSSGGGRLRIATSVAPITSIVAEVAGGLATVEGLVPEGANSHTFEPSPSAARKISRADIIFVNGLGLEDPLRELAQASLSEGSELVSLGDLAIGPDAYIFDFSFPRSGGRPNPHLWTSPPLARRFAELVAETLARRDPDNATAYEANLHAYVEQIDALDRAMVAATATVPVEERKLLTYHDAYAYFARHYGWTVLGAIQPSSFSEPTAREVAALIEQVRSERVPAIFGSEVFPSPILEQIGREAGVRYVDTLRDDDLPGRVGDAEHSWLGLMRFNFVTMVEALGGDSAALRAIEVIGTQSARVTYTQ